MNAQWLSVKEAAALLGYSEDYFRRTFCNPVAPLVAIRIRTGPAGGRRFLVSKEGVETLIQSAIRGPARG